MRIINLILITMIIFSSSCTKNDEKTKNTNDKKKAIVSNTVQLTPKAVDLSEIHIFTVNKKIFSKQIKTNGIIKENENNVFQINSNVSGRIVKDNVILGSHIKQGQVLASVQNQEVVKVYSNYIHEAHINEINIKQSKIKLDMSKKNLEREEKLFKEGISSRKDYEQALSDETLIRSEIEGLEEHRTHLKNEADALLSSYGVKLGKTNSEFIESISPIIASKSGVITKKNITVGRVITPEQVLYEISNLSELWLDISIYDKDINNIKIGQKIIFKSNNIPDHEFLGKISYLEPAKNNTNQTFTARAVLDNSSMKLKTGMFGDVLISEQNMMEKLFLPKNSIQTYGKETFVFIVAGNGKYNKTPVVLGEPLSDGYIVNNGVKQGDRVVGKGSFVLKAEMLKSQFKDEE